MQAAVAYETTRGNTHAIADAIRAGLKTAFDVTIVPSVIR
jgi:flavodoxin